MPWDQGLLNDQSYMPESLEFRSDLNYEDIFQSDLRTDESFNHQLARNNLDTTGSIQHIARLMNEKTKTKRVGQGWSSCNFLSLWFIKGFESLERGIGRWVYIRKSILQQDLDKVAELLQRLLVRVDPERDEGLGWLQLRWRKIWFKQSLCLYLFVCLSVPNSDFSFFFYRHFGLAPCCNNLARIQLEG